MKKVNKEVCIQSTLMKLVAVGKGGDERRKKLNHDTHLHTAIAREEFLEKLRTR